MDVLFVIGMPRSGTKLLRDILNRHPDVAIFPVESHFLPYFHARFRTTGISASAPTSIVFTRTCSGAAMEGLHREDAVGHGATQRGDRRDPVRGPGLRARRHRVAGLRLTRRRRRQRRQMEKKAASTRDPRHRIDRRCHDGSAGLRTAGSCRGQGCEPAVPEDIDAYSSK